MLIEIYSNFISGSVIPPSGKLKISFKPGISKSVDSDVLPVLSASGVSPSQEQSPNKSVKQRMKTIPNKKIVLIFITFS